MAVDIVVIGAGGFGRETLDVVAAINRSNCYTEPPGIELNVLGVADDDPSAKNLDLLAERGCEYLGTTDQVLENLEPRHFVIGIGHPEMKVSIDCKFSAEGWKAYSLIHPRAVIGTQVSIGDGTVICGGVQLSTNTRTGRHVHLNPNATIGHDTELHDFVSINPGAVISGNVVLGTQSLVGAGAVVLQQLSIGSHAIVAAGACVIKDVTPSATALGVPAREKSK